MTWNKPDDLPTKDMLTNCKNLKELYNMFQQYIKLQPNTQQSNVRKLIKQKEKEHTKAHIESILDNKIIYNYNEQYKMYMY